MCDRTLDKAVERLLSRYRGGELWDNSRVSGATRIRRNAVSDLIKPS